jgi:hypothetical protein
MYLQKKEQSKNTCFANKRVKAALLNKGINLFLAIFTGGIWFMIITIRQIIISQQIYQTNNNTIKNEL